jgi:hypothetical protein
MSKFNKIIPLGHNCNVTFLLQHLKLKKETSLFEWFQSETLTAINSTLAKIDWLNIDSYVPYKNGVYVNLGLDVFSNHYTLEEFKPIFVRRAKRFYKTIQNEDTILFIRLNVSTSTTTLEEIEEFRSTIESMILDNTRIEKMRFMLISTIHKPEDFVPIQHDWIIHRYILRGDVNDGYMKDDIKIQHQLREFLTEAGFNIEDTLHKEWNDHSEF